MMPDGTPSNISHGGRVLSLGGHFVHPNQLATSVAWKAVFKGPSPKVQTSKALIVQGVLAWRESKSSVAIEQGRPEVQVQKQENSRPGNFCCVTVCQSSVSDTYPTHQEKMRATLLTQLKTLISWTRIARVMSFIRAFFSSCVCIARGRLLIRVFNNSCACIRPRFGLCLSCYSWHISLLIIAPSGHRPIIHVCASIIC